MPGDEWQPSCYDCGREMAYRNLQPTPVHIDHEDGIGYDRVDVPMCHACRLKRFPTHECPECGEEWLDISDAVECCQHRRGRPMPDGGRDVHKDDPPIDLDFDAEDLAEKDGRPVLWIGRISQEVGIDIIQPATTRGVARVMTEQVCSETLDDPITEWVEDWADGTSELGVRDSGERAIISRRYLETEDSL